MRRKPKISIEEQLYRAGIWERPPLHFHGTADEMPITKAINITGNASEWAEFEEITGRTFK